MTAPTAPAGTTKPLREVWTARQVADYLQLHLRTVHYMAKRKELPGRQIGSTWRFYRDELENLPIK